MTTLSTVILSWENPEDTIRCARSVIASIDAVEAGDYIVIIVDNGSSESTVTTLSDWLEGQDDNRLMLICNESNRGFSAGMNTGIQRSRTLGESDYYWLLNNDLRVDTGAASALLQKAGESKDTVIWGPTILSEKTGKTECAGGCRYLPSIGYFLPACAGLDKSKLPQISTPQMDYISGAAMFLDGGFLDRIGGLDESYFLYYEELELARQIAPGEKINWNRSAIVHHVGAGSSVIAGVERRKTLEATISALRYTGKYHPYYLPTVFLARFLGVFARGARQLDLLLPAAVLAGGAAYVAEVIRGHPKISRRP